jgi:hypothetical protein
MRESVVKRLRRVPVLMAVIAAILGLVAPTAAQAAVLPVPPIPAVTPLLPPNLSVPYLPGVGTVCPGGEISCFTSLEQTLATRTAALGCEHEAIFSVTYQAITGALIGAVNTPGYFDRPSRITHEGAMFAQRYLSQFDAWHTGHQSAATPAWQIAWQAAHDGTVTTLGDLLLGANAHIQGDQSTVIDQGEGILRVPGTMPAASGFPDHRRVDPVLQAAVVPLVDYLSAHYDPEIGRTTRLFGIIMDPAGLYFLFSLWREKAIRDAETLRQLRVLPGGINNPLYVAKVAADKEWARVSAIAIMTATPASPAQRIARDTYCQAHAA